jgi:hypothetical protein
MRDTPVPPSAGRRDDRMARLALGRKSGGEPPHSIKEKPKTQAQTPCLGHPALPLAV